MDPGPTSPSRVPVSRPGKSALAILAAALLSLSIALPASAATKFKVLNGDKAGSVVLQACPGQAEAAASSDVCAQAGNQPTRFLSGQVTLLVHNESGKEETLEIEYVGEGDSTGISLPGSSSRVFLKGGLDGGPVPESDGPPLLANVETRPISVGFVLEAGEPPSEVDGSLVMKLDGEAVAVAVTGVAQSFKGLSVRPASLKMDSDQKSAQVTLLGPDVLEFLRSSGPGLSTATLYGDDGETAKVKLELPTVTDAARGNPDRAEATVTPIGADPPAGKYTGKLSLSDLVPEAPTIDVELSSRRGFCLLIFLAFLGVLVGGVLSRLVALAMRRRQLLAFLKQSMDAYEYVLGTGETKSWSLEDLLGNGDAEPNENRLQGLPALEHSIEKARSTSDLDEDAKRVLDMIARLQRWLRVEPVARRLTLICDQRKPPKSLGNYTWKGSRTLADTRALLQMTRREPADVEKADDLVARLLFQLDWHNRLAAAWSFAVGGQAGSSPKGLAKELKELDESLGKGDKTAGTRTLDEQDQLKSRLQAMIESLPPQTPVPAPPPLPEEPQKELGNGITPVIWDASSNLFTGWATLDGPSYGQLTRRAATTTRALSRPRASDLKTEICSLRPADLGWTFVALALASVAYGVEGYGETWGTDQDLAEAFFAGFLGKVAVNWAALPLFRSIRLRAAAKAESD
jgi:hypothetical protein